MSIKLNFIHYLRNGLEFFKAQPLPSVVAALLTIVPILGQIVLANLLRAALVFQREKRVLVVTDLFDFDRALDKFLTGLAVGIGFGLLFVPGCLVLFAPAILADRVGADAPSALRGAFSFSRRALLPSILLALFLGACAGVGSVALGVGVLVTLPIAVAALMTAYEEQRDAILRAAHEDGVSLSTPDAEPGLS